MGGPGSGARPREYPPEVVELACRLYESGLSVKQVQRHIPGFRAQTILTRYLPNLRPSGSQAKGAPSYKTLHSRLSRTRGRAAEHTCVDCGGPGQFLAGRKSKDKLNPRPRLDTEPAPF